MKKLMTLATLLMVGVLSCASGSKKPQEQTNNVNCTDASCALRETGAPAVPTSDVVAEENWQFTMSGDGWVPTQSPDNVVKVVFLNKTLNAIVFFAKDPTQQTSPQYIINALRSFKAAGTTIATAKQVSINGNNFIYVVANGEDRQIQAWLTVKNNFGYILTCAVESDDAGAPNQLCQDIASTVQIQ
jgi:hypothetical protein